MLFQKCIVFTKCDIYVVLPNRDLMLFFCFFLISVGLYLNRINNVYSSCYLYTDSNVQWFVSTFILLYSYVSIILINSIYSCLYLYTDSYVQWFVSIFILLYNYILRTVALKCTLTATTKRETIQNNISVGGTLKKCHETWF